MFEGYHLLKSLTPNCTWADILTDFGVVLLCVIAGMLFYISTVRPSAAVPLPHPLVHGQHARAEHTHHCSKCTTR